jgi:hypothetical protein
MQGSNKVRDNEMKTDKQRKYISEAMAQKMAFGGREEIKNVVEAEGERAIQ